MGFPMIDLGYTLVLPEKPKHGQYWIIENRKDKPVHIIFKNEQIRIVQVGEKIGIVYELVKHWVKPEGYNSPVFITTRALVCMHDKDDDREVLWARLNTENLR